MMGDYRQLQNEAARRLRAELDKPSPEVTYDIGAEGFFNPWDTFPSLFGTYSAAFDECAIRVLTNLRDQQFDGENLAEEMFREMLCTAELCEYGTSPRVCFPATQEVRDMLPEWIDKWKAYSMIHWGSAP